MTTTGTTLVQPAAAETAADRIRHVKLSTLTLPLDTPISDAKVLTGRQKPMTETSFFSLRSTPRTTSTGSVLATPNEPAVPPSTHTPGRLPTT